jgi:hypothetical protein
MGAIRNAVPMIRVPASLNLSILVWGVCTSLSLEVA